MADAPSEPPQRSPGNPSSSKTPGTAKSLFADIASDLDDLPRRPVRTARRTPPEPPKPQAESIASGAEPAEAGPQSATSAPEPDTIAEAESAAAAAEAVEATPLPAASAPEPETVAGAPPSALAAERAEATPEPVWSVPESVAPAPEPIAPAPEAVAPTAESESLTEPEPVGFPRATVEWEPPLATDPEPAAGPRHAPAGSGEVTVKLQAAHPKPAEISAAPPSRRPGTYWPWLVAAAAVVVTAVVSGLALSQWGPFGARPTSTGWTAVLLSNNDVFFGHVKQTTNDRIELTNVYYVQKPSGTDAATQPLAIVSLVANQIQCPRDAITINRADVAYWEELQDSSYVVTRLNQLGQTPQSCFQPPAASPGAAQAPAAAQAPQASPIPPAPSAASAGSPGAPALTP
jgi:hypothetical protein